MFLCCEMGDVMMTPRSRRGEAGLREDVNAGMDTHCIAMSQNIHVTGN